MNIGKEQNSLWFKIYKNYRQDPSIKDQNFQYILMRDMVSHVFTFLIAGTAFLLFDFSLNKLMLFVIPTLLFLILLCLSVQNRAERFVLSVVALYCTEP